MYPAYAKWVQSHRDLPVRLNQWCNVVVGARVLLVGLHFHVSIAFRACFLSFEHEAVFKGFWTTKFVLIINHVLLLIKISCFFFSYTDWLCPCSAGNSSTRSLSSALGSSCGRRGTAPLPPSRRQLTR